MDEWIVPDWPAPFAVRAFVTTRCGGVSRGPWAGFNLADHVGDDPRAVAANRERLRLHLPAGPVWLRQVHGTRCVIAEDVNVGDGEADVEADAVVSFRPGTVCAVLTADCLPVLFCDTAATAVGAAHAGWRGLAAGVLEATVAALDRPPADLIAWLGPAIGARAFEVGDEVPAIFSARDASAADAFVPHGKGKWLCDLYHLARKRLAALGVHHVAGGRSCTVNDADRFYSYRRDGATGRMASLIWLEQQGGHV